MKSTLTKGTSNDDWAFYERIGAIEARPYRHGDQVYHNLSISEADLKLPTLLGGWIARNPENRYDEWYIAGAYFSKHYRRAK